MTRDEAYRSVVEGWLRDNRGIVFTEGSVDDLCDRIAAEVERLTADRDRWQHDALGWSDRLTEATAELERLRAALREIDAIRTASDWNGKTLDHAAEIARRALEPKP